jgi:ferredoxin
MTFTVLVDESDIAFAYETGETVLDAAERAGYSLPYSCRKGICSTCEGELCRGTLSVGSKQFAGPAGGVLLCQARPQSDVLIHAKRIDSAHAGDSVRCGRIDSANPAMRDRAAQDRGMQHALAPQIANKFAAAPQKAKVLDPLDRTADVTVRPDHGFSVFR